MKHDTLTEFPKNTLVVYSPVRQIQEKRTFIVREKTGPVHGIVLSKSLLGLLDIIAAICIVAPLVVSQWRGTWMLLSYYNAPWWLQKSVGVGLHMLFALARKPMQSFFTKTDKKILRAVAVRIYVWVFGVACVSHWQGSWLMLDLYTHRRLGDVLGITTVSVALLSMLKALRNISTSPFSITVDNGKNGTDFPTMFRTSRNLRREMLKTGTVNIQAWFFYFFNNGLESMQRNLANESRVKPWHYSDKIRLPRSIEGRIHFH